MTGRKCILPKFTCRSALLCVCLLFLTLGSACDASIVVEHALCRGGQVFLHWSDSDTAYIRYHIYRHSLPIDSAEALNDAELIESNAALGSAKDRTATYIAAKSGHTDPNVGLRLFDLGDTLDPLDGLKVITINSAAQNYYAIIGINSDGTEDRVVVPGANSLASPVEESPGSPSPVLEEEGSINVSGYIYPWKTYTWYRRSDEALQDGTPTKITVTIPANTASKYPAMVYLHAYGGYNIKQTWWNTIIVSPCDYTPDLPYSGYSWWYGYGNAYPDVTSGTVFNYTENMLLRMIEWAETNFPIDPNRIFLSGGSMGGTGSISFGFRHPDIVAGISAQVPQVNPALPGIGWSQTQLQAIWGDVSRNLPTNEGFGVWDRMNMTNYAANHKEDLPFLKVQNSKNDTTLLWFQIPDFYKNLNTSRHGFVAAWGQGGHGSSSTGLPSGYLNFDIYSKIKLNQSYVAVSNSSANNNPGSGNVADGDSIGQMNSGYDWSILSDNKDQWSALIKYTGGDSAYADISARRLQNFNFTAGDRLAYSLWDGVTGSVVQTGHVNAERDRLFVISHLPFGSTGNKLAVWKSSTQTVADVAGLNEGADVDLDEMIVTAAFSDVCYAQPLNRLPAIAILGASNLCQGNLIRLRGTKSTFGHMCAVTASPTSPAVFGNASLKPFGMELPLYGFPGKPVALGALVRTWAE